MKMTILSAVLLICWRSVESIKIGSNSNGKIMSLVECEKANSLQSFQTLLKVGSSAVLGNVAAGSLSSSNCNCVYHGAVGSQQNGLLRGACSCNCLKCGGSFLAPPAANARVVTEGWYNPSNERIFDTLHKSYVPAHPEIMLPKDLADKNVITVGEVHSNPLDHKIEFEVIRSLANMKSPENVAIGLECFYRQHQRALNRFIFVHQDMGILKAETNWDETWGYDLNCYAKIFNFAAKNRIRLVGLNVPIQVAKLVSKVGFNELPKSLKELMPVVDLTVATHKQYFIESIRDSTHMKMDPDAFQKMYETQTLWDEYMAESASQYVRKFPKSTIVVLAGLGHVVGRTSIPDRIQKRVDVIPFVIVPQQVEWSSENGLPLVTQPLTHADCDWAWYTERELETKKM